LPVEKFIQGNFALDILFVVFLWSCAEELFKFIAAYLAAMDTREYDEPIDAVVYMITAALGFSAMENVFFLVASISSSNIVESLITGNLRFIGATLLHVLSSGVIGLFVGLSFYKSWIVKKIYLAVGVILAVLLHTSFNIYIMKSAGTSIFIIFCFVWVAILLLIAGFEKVKRLKAVRQNVT
jgi:RsiW-degrading membrane proteinase PrsW (M82 family)